MSAKISERARNYLAAWHSRRPAFATMGEFSSGKSALLNCLLGRTLLPTRATATDMPAIWITHGKTETIRGLSFNGHLVTLSMDDLAEGRAMQYLCVRIETSAEILAQVDVIDTPGISDPRMTTEIVEEMARHVDFVVWCSPMNQAWRQTERAFWASLPQSAKSGSLLALTRADLMSRPKDIEKVVRRCVAETDGSFAAVLPIAAPLAIEAGIAATVEERDLLLQASGVPAFTETLRDSVIEAAKKCAARPSITEPAALKILPLTKEMLEPAEVPQKKANKSSPKAQSTKASRKIKAQPFALLDAAKNFPRNEHGLDIIRHLMTQLTKDKTIGVEHRTVLARALTVGDAGDLVMERLMKQVENEIQDFADGPWCDLRR